jgi:hypothetical protein
VHLPHLSAVVPAARRLRAAIALAFVGMAFLAAPAQADGTPPADRWEALRRDDLRVATMLYRLTLANRSSCAASLAPQPGFALHGIAQYGPGDRREATRRFGLGAYVGVMAVVAGSPAAQAGLRAGDQLVSVNGRALPANGGSATVPTNASVEVAETVLLGEMAKGPVTLVVASAKGQRTVRFSAETGCRSTIELVPGDLVNASADGEKVMIDAGLLARCVTEDDLAMVIAHELAHNLLHHAARLAQAGITTHGLPVAGSALAEMRATEEEADRLGVRLATAAGYDLTGVAAFLGALETAGGADRAAATHPAPARRLALLTAEIAAAKSAPGQPAHLPRRTG